MKINFYDTRLLKNGRTVLVKEKAVSYDAGRLDNPHSVVKMMNGILHMNRLAEEYCYMISLNMSCNALGVFFISKGTVSESLIGARELYIRALMSGAAMIIICHNHTSENAMPSKADIDTTNRLREAGKLIGVHLSDHVIIARNDYYSFMEHGMLQ